MTLVASCYKWLLEAQEMARRALLSQVDQKGMNYLYDPRKEVTKHAPIRDIYFYEQENPRYDAIMHQGFLKHAFVMSFYYLLLADHNTLKTTVIGVSNYFYSLVMKEIASLGGDTDTNCCIVGAIIGAYVGSDNIDTSMLTKVFSFDCTDEENLVYLGTKRPHFLNVGPYCVRVIDKLIQ